MADRSGQFTGKPRPAVIVQADQFAELQTVTVCPITSVDADAPLLRIPLEPSASLPLDHRSWVEVDKITTVYCHRVGQRIGHVADADMLRLTSAVAVLLGVG